MSRRQVLKVKEKRQCFVVDCKSPSSLTTVKNGRTYCKTHYKSMKRSERGNYFINERKRRYAYTREPGAKYKHLIHTASIRGLVVAITLSEYKKILLKPCDYCGDKLDGTGAGLDRKDPTCGYTIKNVSPCCGYCNHMKSIFLPHEFDAHIKKICFNHIFK